MFVAAAAKEVLFMAFLQTGDASIVESADRAGNLTGPSFLDAPA
jgi:hypothetical protein